MIEHTPTPWKVEQDHHFGPGFVITAAHAGMGNRCPLVRMQSPLGDADTTLEGDATFIVRAVNAHDVLVKALNDLHVWCEIEGCGDQAEIIKDAFVAAGITEHRCANCDGLGEWDEGPLPATSSTQTSPDYRHMVCSDCDGKGTIALLPPQSSPPSGGKAQP